MLKALELNGFKSFATRTGHSINYIKTQNGIKYEDNYSFRKLLQEKGPELHQVPAPQDDGSPCGLCDSSLNLSDVNWVKLLKIKLAFSMEL